jgi:putative iron-regulated protein
MKTKHLLLLITGFVILISSCKKDPETTETPTIIAEDLGKKILEDFSEVVAAPIYDDMSAHTELLLNHVLELQANPDENKLTTCKQDWRNARSSWEKSEAFLFGPVSTENIDPRIDTWPVNFQDLEGELSSSNVFTHNYIDGLQDALKGFHPIEYLLFGQQGNKTHAEFTTREFEYLVALCENLKELTGSLSTSWDASTNGNYASILASAGAGSSVYDNKLSAYEEMINAMAGICSEVAEGKMNEPFVLQDPTLEESPFAFNSITDFTNNIRGVENVYLAKFNQDGSGLEDLVRQHNLSLDSKIKSKIQQAIAALQNITVPFGQAITEQPVQVQNAIDAIESLEETLSGELMNFILVYGNL